MERLFIIIGRINSILLLLILFGAGFSIAWVSWSSNQWQRRGAIEVPTSEIVPRKIKCYYGLSVLRISLERILK